MVSSAQRRRLTAAARSRCGYCHTQEVVSGIPLTVEHLIPKAKGGTDDTDNLWLSCRLCNERKGTLTEAIDPDTGSIVALFNPRTQIWSEHFAWSVDGSRILPLTAVGRVTVHGLTLNHELRVRARALWVQAGYHPPD